MLEGRSRGSPAARGSYCRQLSPFQSMQSLGGVAHPLAALCCIRQLPCKQREVGSERCQRTGAAAGGARGCGFGATSCKNAALQGSAALLPPGEGEIWGKIPGGLVSFSCFQPLQLGEHQWLGDASQRGHEQLMGAERTHAALHAGCSVGCSVLLLALAGGGQLKPKLWSAATQGLGAEKLNS